MIRYVKTLFRTVLGPEQDEEKEYGSAARLHEHLHDAQEGLTYILSNLRMLEEENKRYHTDIQGTRRQIDEAMQEERPQDAEFQAASLLQLQTALDRNETQLEAARLSFERIASVCRSLQNEINALELRKSNQQH